MLRPTAFMKKLKRSALWAGLFSCVFGLGMSQVNAKPVVYHYDVVVIGAGAAGLTAAVSAAEHGASVMVIEKMPTVGGNSVLSAGYMLAPITQKNTPEKGIYTPQLQAQEETQLRDMIVTEGQGANDPLLVKTLVARSGKAIDWLRRLGADLVRDSNDFPLRVQSQSTLMVGEEVVKTLLQDAETLRIPIQTQARVSRLLIDDQGRVTGVSVITGRGRQYDVAAHSVIIATGGFAANEQLTGVPLMGRGGLNTTNMPGSIGDGILLLEPLHPQMINMKDVVIHATTLPFSNLVMPVQARHEGGIVVDGTGRRFANELSLKLWKDIVDKSFGRAWLIVDQGIIDKMPVLKNYARYGYLYKAQNEEELARYMHVNPQVFANEMRRYRMLAEMKNDLDFHRPTLDSTLREYPLYAVSIQPALHGTPGGLKINVNTEVLNQKNEPIPGVFAAGEVTGGVFGKGRIQGTGLMDAIVYGRIAGIHAAHYAKMLEKKYCPLNEPNEPLPSPETKPALPPSLTHS